RRPGPGQAGLGRPGRVRPSAEGRSQFAQVGREPGSDLPRLLGARARCGGTSGESGRGMSADTPQNVQERYARLMMALPPAKRVALCAAMSTSARAMVRRSLEQRGLVGDQLADALVARLYGTD